MWAPLTPIGGGGVLSNVAEPTKKGFPFFPTAICTGPAPFVRASTLPQCDFRQLVNGCVLWFAPVSEQLFLLCPSEQDNLYERNWVFPKAGL